MKTKQELARRYDRRRAQQRAACPDAGRRLVERQAGHLREVREVLLGAARVLGGDAQRRAAAVCADLEDAAARMEAMAKAAEPRWEAAALYELASTRAEHELRDLVRQREEGLGYR
jgi:hypothetical protein